MAIKHFAMKKRQKPGAVGNQKRSCKQGASPVVGTKKRNKVRVWDSHFGLRIWVRPADTEEFKKASDALWETQAKWTKKQWAKALNEKAKSLFGLARWGGKRVEAIPANATTPVAGSSVEVLPANATTPVAGSSVQVSSANQPDMVAGVEGSVATEAGSTSPSQALISPVANRTIPLQHGESTLSAVYDASGALAVMKAEHASGAFVPFTPQPVVDWLYQVLGIALSVIQKLLGTNAAFDANGNFKDKDRGEKASGGMLTTFWGTELGTRRDQALVAWDYDVDLAAFITDDCDFDRLWRQAAEILEPFDLRLINHTRNLKYRICPKHALAYNVWKERYQLMNLENPGKGRSKLTQMASLSKARHEPLQSPNGSNCLDLEIYVVRPRAHIAIRGSATYKIPCSAIFPIAEGIFGPLRVPVPASSQILDFEYGRQWRHKRVVKAVQKSGKSVEIDISALNARRCAWPAVPLHSCSELLGGFYGVGLDRGSSDTQWRYAPDCTQRDCTE
jgi:hypothetical protein